MDLLLIAAIAYAAARGFESIVNDARGTYNSRVADAAVKKAAKTKNPDDGKEAGPTDPGGTFSAKEAAPRTATIGTRTAAFVATGVQAGATAWQSFGEGYRDAWPTAREDARKRQVERTKKRQAAREVRHERRRAEREAAEAQRQADAAAKAAGAAEAARVAAEEAAGQPAATDPDDTPVFTGPPDPSPPLAPPVAGPSPATAPASPKPTLILLKPQPTPATAPTGDTVIPEVRTLDGLLNALLITKGNCLMRAEEADAIAARDIELASQLDTFEAGLADLEVDPETLAEIASLREKIAAQSAAASGYGIAAQNAADLAAATANAAHMAHGGIAEAVQSAPIEAAAQAGYYNR